MKVSVSIAALIALSGCEAFAPPAFGVSSSARVSVGVNANIRGPTEKAEELRFGWDGTQARGGAVENAAPTRMLEDIRAAGETIPSDCEVFNANVEMDASDLKFEEVMELIDVHYESGLIEFKNGDIVNKPDENEGSAKVSDELYTFRKFFPRKRRKEQEWGQIMCVFVSLPVCVPLFGNDTVVDPIDSH